jgi:hypothetical protein
MSLARAYEEVIDFIAAGTSPDLVAAFRPSEATKQRVAELVRREKTNGLTADETSELEHYVQLEHLNAPGESPRSTPSVALIGPAAPVSTTYNGHPARPA